LNLQALKKEIKKIFIIFLGVAAMQPLRVLLLYVWRPRFPLQVLARSAPFGYAQRATPRPPGFTLQPLTRAGDFQRTNRPHQLSKKKLYIVCRSQFTTFDNPISKDLHHSISK
jgi:hypothetical protein